MQVDINLIAREVAGAVMGNPILQITFAPGAEQDGFQSDLQIELVRMLRQRLDMPIAEVAAPKPVWPLPDNLNEIVLLAIFEAMHGEGDSSDYKYHWLNMFMGDERPDIDDTFNRCHRKGWLKTTHNSDIDASTTRLTPEGRAHLALARGEAS